MSPKQWTVEVTHPDQTPKGETPVRRSILSPLVLTETPDPAIRTIYDLVQFSARRWADKPCFGTRKVIKIHTEKQIVSNAANAASEPKVYMFWELGPYEYRSYKEVAQEGLDVGSGLRKLGLERGDKIAIYAETSYFLVTSGANSVHTGN
jgi:long-chain acyl-CoA synthetase